MTTTEKATQRQRSASHQKQKTNGQNSTSKSSEALNAAPEVPADAVPLERVLHLFQSAKVPGLMSRESLRRAFHSNRLPGYIRGKNRIYFKPEPILELIGSMPVGDGGSVDQALIRHYEASEFNTPISAVMAGLAVNLGKARQVFNDWSETMQDPKVAARLEAKKQADAVQAAKIEPPIAPPACDTCNRTYAQASKDDEDVNLAVIGHKESPNASEMLALTQFQDMKCTGCWKWLPKAPTTSMREHFASVKT